MRARAAAIDFGSTMRGSCEPPVDALALAPHQLVALGEGPRKLGLPAKRHADLEELCVGAVAADGGLPQLGAARAAQGARDKEAVDGEQSRQGGQGRAGQQVLWREHGAHQELTQSGGGCLSYSSCSQARRHVQLRFSSRGCRRLHVSRRDAAAGGRRAQAISQPPSLSWPAAALLTRRAR